MCSVVAEDALSCNLGLGQRLWLLSGAGCFCRYFAFLGDSHDYESLLRRRVWAWIRGLSCLGIWW